MSDLKNRTEIQFTYYIKRYSVIMLIIYDTLIVFPLDMYAYIYTWLFLMCHKQDIVMILTYLLPSIWNKRWKAGVRGWDKDKLCEC